MDPSRHQMGQEKSQRDVAIIENILLFDVGETGPGVNTTICTSRSFHPTRIY